MSGRDKKHQDEVESGRKERETTTQKIKNCPSFHSLPHYVLLETLIPLSRIACSKSYECD